MKRFLIVTLLLCTLTTSINVFAAVDKTEKTLVEGKVKIKWYKENARCYITILGDISTLSSDEITAIRTALNNGADGANTPYTKVDLATKNYSLTQSDLDKIFGETNGFLQGLTNNIKVLSLKDINLEEEYAANYYGQQIGYLPALEELTTPKSCQGPNMNSPSPKYKTIKKLIIPKLGANDGSDKAKATVGNWEGYTALESIDLNTSIAPNTTIADRAFFGCKYLKTVKIMSTNIVGFGQDCFRDCYRLEKITLPYGLKTIGNGAFYNCFLKNINLPQTLETIEQDAFRNNPMVRTIKIPASVKTIGVGAFLGMPELDNVYVYGNNVQAVAGAFDKDCIGERFTYTPDLNTKKIENDETHDASHVDWSRGEYKKVESVTVDDEGHHITYSNAPRVPAQLHILDNDEARMHYMNPFLRFLNGGYKDYSAASLVDFYKNVGEHLGETSTTAGWNQLKPYLATNEATTVVLNDVCNTIIGKINAYDTNSDNTITKEEAGLKVWNDANLDNYDYSDPKDGIITKESFAVKFWDEYPLLQSYDTNNDGSITKEDVGAKAIAAGGAMEEYATYLSTEDNVTRDEVTDASWTEFYGTTYAAYVDEGKITKTKIETENPTEAKTIWNAIKQYKDGDNDYITEDSYKNYIWDNNATLTAWDANSDRTITRSEINEKAWTDASGDLSGYEYYNWTNLTRTTVRDQHWRTIYAYDYNGDGTISKEEVADHTWETSLAVYDYNNDNSINLSTLCPDISAAISGYDTDNNGTITQAEVAAAANWLEKIAKYDYDNDGTIEREDAQNYYNNNIKSFFQGLDNQITNYLESVYFNGEDENKAKYNGNNRPWVNYYESATSDVVTMRLPYESSEPQFTAPVTDPANAIEGNAAPYAGFNQFLLVLADAQSAQPETDFEKWQGSKWYSICLPFTISRYMVEETFGTQTEVCEFTSVVKDEEGKMTFYFTNEVQEDDLNNYMLAYHPYMIHPSLTTVQTGTSNGHPNVRVILGVTDEDKNNQKNMSDAQKAERQVTVGLVNNYDAGYDNENRPSKYTFKGAADAAGTIPAGAFFWAYTKSGGVETENGSFYRNAKTTALTLPQYTAMIELTAGENYYGTTSSSSSSKVSTLFDWEDAEYYYNETTGILEVSFKPQTKVQDQRVYNLNGQFVGESLNGLSKGIYIMNGKKYVVK